MDRKYKIVADLVGLSLQYTVSPELSNRRQMAESKCLYLFSNHKYIKIYKTNETVTGLCWLQTRCMGKTLLQLISCQLPSPNRYSALDSVVVLASTATNISNLGERPLLIIFIVVMTRIRGS
jgi:hypothetical protein